MKELGVRVTIVVLAALGGWGAGRVSLLHWSGEVGCPMIGRLPACYLILLGYSLIIVSMYPSVKKSLAVFLSGWVPVAGLALIGVSGELTGIMKCPQTESGIPMCYLSAVLSLVLGLVAWPLFNRIRKSSCLAPLKR